MDRRTLGRGAGRMRLSADDLARIEEVAAAGTVAGDRYADMSTVHR